MTNASYDSVILETDFLTGGNNELRPPRPLIFSRKTSLRVALPPEGRLTDVDTKGGALSVLMLGWPTIRDNIRTGGGPIAIYDGCSIVECNISSGGAPILFGKRHDTVNSVCLRGATISAPNNDVVVDGRLTIHNSRIECFNLHVSGILVLGSGCVLNTKRINGVAPLPDDQQAAILDMVGAKVLNEPLLLQEETWEHRPVLSKEVPQSLASFVVAMSNMQMPYGASPVTFAAALCPAVIPVLGRPIDDILYFLRSQEYKTRD